MLFALHTLPAQRARLALSLILVAASWAFPSTQARADVTDPFLVEDLDPTRSSVGGAVAVGLADTTLLLQSGGGIWTTDGTAAGTEPLPLPDDARVNATHWLTPDRSRAYFVASTDGAGLDIFVTDGTAAGTQRLTTGGGISARTTGFTTFVSPSTGDFYFTRILSNELGQNSHQLWVSDGTPAGTRRLIEFSDPPILGAEVDGFVLFAGYDDDRKRALFRTDGTPEGTVQISSVEASFSSPAFVSLGDRALFAGFEEETGVEPYVTDGTPAGTRLLADLVPGPAGLGLGPFLLSGDLVYIGRDEVSSRSLVVTDGTTAGTRELARFSPSGNSLLDFRLYPFGDGLLFFQGLSDEGSEPWIADGEEARLLKDLCPGDCSSNPRPLAATGDGLYFTADDGVTGTELYFTDGTTTGTKRVADLCAGPCPSIDGGTATLGNTLYFFARTHNREREIYRTTDGATPTPVTDFESPEPFSVLGLRVANDLVYFTVAEADDPVLYATDGTPGGSRPVLDLETELFPRSSEPRAFASFDGDLLFVARDGANPTLFRKTGDQPSQVLAVLTAADAADREWARIHVLGSRAVIVTDLDLFGEGDLWVTDGTPGGTALLADDLSIDKTWTIGNRLLYLDGRANTLWAIDGVGSPVPLTRNVSSISPIAPWKDQLLYVERGALWKTDGTPAGTRRIETLASSGSTSLLSLHAAGSVFYFVGDDPSTFKRRVFRSDGTAAGTVAASPVDVEVSEGIGVAGKRLVFLGRRNEEAALWSTDGTPAGTVRLMDIGFLGLFNREHRQARLGPELWFATDEGFVIRTDGTPGGTSTVSLFPADSSAFGQLFEIPGHLLYVRSADGGGIGRELWVTDGSATGTRFLRTFAILRSEFHPHGDRVYFAADGAPTVGGGEELWAVGLEEAGPPPPPPPPPTGVPAAPRSLRVEGRHNAVHLTWNDASDNETRFVIQAQGWQANRAFRTVLVVPAGSTSAILNQDVDFNAFDPHLFRVRAENSEAVSPWSEVGAGSAVDTTRSCRSPGTSPEVLCLQDGRFEVQVYWRVDRGDGFGNSGRGRAAPFDFSDDSGTFWFFDEDNIELVVKVLDARTVNGFYWNFYGALSDVEYWIVVTDTTGNENATYYNPPRELCGQADVRGFPRSEALAAFSDATTGAGRKRLPTVPSPLDNTGSGVCVPDADTLCLTPDRYRVTVTWRDPRSGDTGVGRAIPGTSDSGYFWFFDPENVELVVKVLDARTVNGFVWVFYGALTDVEYTLTVTDTTTGAQRTYRNEPGNICGNADVRAF